MLNDCVEEKHVSNCDDDDNIMVVWETYMEILPEVLAEDGVEDGVSGAVDVGDDHGEDVHGPVLVEL